MLIIDWVVVVFYITVILATGYVVKRRIKSAGGFLLGNRRLGAPMMIASTFAGGVNANNPISVASNAYSNGLSGMWLTMAFMIATPIFWMWPPVLRRLRVVTLVDFFRMRYGRGMEWLKLVISVLVAPFTVGVGIKAAAMLVIAMAGTNPDGSGAISTHTAIAMIVIPTVVYTLLGGVIAAYAIDMFQSILIIALSFILLPFMVWKVGSSVEVVARVDAHNANYWNLLGGTEGVSGLWLFWFAVSLCFSALAVYGGGSGAARNEMAARWAVVGNLGKRVCTVGWGLTGLFAIALFGAPAVSGVRPDDVFAAACLQTMPAGLRGVMVAAMLAAAMSTLATMMLNFSGNMVNNLYKDYLARHASPAHYLTMARVFAVVPMGLGWAVAASGIGLIHLVVLTEQVNSTLGVAMLAAVAWRRSTGIGATLATMAMVPLFYFGNLRPGSWPDWYATIIERGLAFYRLVGIETGIDAAGLASAKPEMLLPLTTPFYLSTGIAVLVLVSLFTRQHNERRVAEFYARADTPLGEEHRLRQAGFQADTLEEMEQRPVDADARDRDQSRRLLLLDLLIWPKLLLTGRAKVTDYWIDLAGIAGSLLFMALLLWAITSIRGWLL